jgi:hypothetical protein
LYFLTIEKHEINIFTKINLFYFWWKDIFWGSEVGGPVVKSEYLITMGMRGEKITFILKKKLFFSAGSRRKNWWKWGVGREPVKLWKNEKNVN